MSNRDEIMMLKRETLMNQTEIANHLGISRQAVSAVLRPKKKPGQRKPPKDPRPGTVHHALWSMRPGDHIYLDKPDRQITAAIAASRHLSNTDFTTMRLVAIPGIGAGANSAFDLVKVTRKPTLTTSGQVRTPEKTDDT